MASSTQFIIVDDSPFIRKQLTLILEKNKFKVVASLTNGMAALASYRKFNPQIMIIDLDMPEMNGILTIQQLLKEYENMQVIAMSALGKQHLIKQALLAGAKDYIVKPLQERQILTVFNRLLSMHPVQQLELGKLSYHRVFKKKGVIGT